MALEQKTIAPPPSQPTAHEAVAAPDEAPAQSAAADQGFLSSPLFMLVMFVPLIVMMFWSSRSQQKKQQKLIAELALGDRVLLQSGIRGKLLELGDRFAKVEIAPGTKVEVLKSALLGKDSAEAAAQLERK
ncbi:MAG: preprotein translocase subunit YajC [Polyangiaceae bacterium]|nr:preprotein translocase subunit YajC [Polyangiaceae bacterium]